MLNNGLSNVTISSCEILWTMYSVSKLDSYYDTIQGVRAVKMLKLWAYQLKNVGGGGLTGVLTSNNNNKKSSPPSEGAARVPFGHIFNRFLGI